MLIDLHCHTNRYSACSSLTPEQLIDGAGRAGLDAVCLTEHDRLWTTDNIRRLAASNGVRVFRGVEITTEIGHILAFGLNELPAGLHLARSVVAAVRAAGGLVAIAHPVRSGQPTVSRHAMAEMFDMVEILNGSDGEAQNQSAEALSGLVRLPGIAGSDCHTPSEIGTVATVLPDAVKDEHELVDVLRMGLHTVRRLGPGASLDESRR
jgi:predicted metal-dependent phosphoesterase TrpH